ncbi:hypothetical protein pb186bvf_012688 [Paramecium bursaria]
MFGYKNLYEPKSIEPGPGFYSLRQELGKKYQSIKKQTPNKLKKLKVIELLETKPKKQKIINKKPEPLQLYFSTSQRSNPFLLPVISKGPQYYQNSLLEDKKGCVPFKGYSYGSESPGVGTYTPKSEQYKIQRKQSFGSQKPFRDYSYLSNTSQEPGPGQYEINKFQSRANRFGQDQRFR